MATRREVRASAVALVLLLAACSSAQSAGPSGTPSPPVSSPPVASAPASPQPPSVGAIASAGCRVGSTPTVTNQRDRLTSSGATRTYLLTTPAPHQQPVPLVVDFHGYGEGAPTEALTTQFSPLAQHDGFLAVYPNGRGHPIAWNTSTKPNNPDLHFVTSLLDHLEATQCVDEARVYATGLSQGAFMSSTVACALSSRFAAVAPVSGVQLSSPCHLARPVPILAFHGTGDPILHFNGGVNRAVLKDDLTVNPKPFPKLPSAQLNGPGYPANVRAWAAKDGCRPKATDHKLSPHVIHRVYHCPTGVAVDFDIILGGGHAWPGSAFSNEIRKFVGTTTMEINATTTIWTFFQRFHLETAPR
jgi:polyhydroxybutyrate depolymerase